MPTLPDITLGLEEELYVLYQGQPDLGSMAGLSRLLWRKPKTYYPHSASNFSRKSGAKLGLMSGVEVSTAVCHTPQELMQSVIARRQDLMNAFPTGHLSALGMIQRDDPYNTAGLHIHIGVPTHRKAAVYGNIARFLPILALASSSSPWQGTQVFGQSYRMHASYALGALRADPLYRFQDLIITRRLGTIEIRVLDPIWDLKRLSALVDAIYQLASLPALDWSAAQYNQLRSVFPQYGLDGLNSAHPTLAALADELYQRTGFESHWSRHTVSDLLVQLAQTAPNPSQGFLAVASHLDSGFRHNLWQNSGTPDPKPAFWHGAWGMLSYYLPRLGYISYKAWVENYGRASKPI